MTNARNAKTAREKAAELRAEAAKAEARRKTITAVAVVATILVRTASDNSAAKTAAAAKPPANLSDGGVLAGNTTAKVTIEVYEDFLCPACKQGELANAAQMEQWAKDGTAKVIYRPVSILDRATTPEGYSSRALNAAAVVMDTKPSAFAAFHKLLFDNQPAEGSAGLTDDQLIEYAVQAGCDKAAVEAPIRDQKFKVWAAAQTDEFSKKGYTGTPTYVVNGTQLKAFDADSLKKAVEAVK